MAARAKSGSDQRDSASLSVGNPYDRAIGPIIPWSAYFYYVKLNSDDPSDRKIVGYYYDHGSRIPDVCQLVKDVLAPNALADADFPPKIGYSFNSVKWRRKSYLIMLVDGRLKFKHNAGLKFKKTTVYKDNHAFRDAHDQDIEIDTETGRRTMSLFYCVNYMCDENNENLNDGEIEKFRFDLVYEGVIRKRGMRLDADGGTNMGPPTPPPGAEL